MKAYSHVPATIQGRQATPRPAGRPVRESGTPRPATGRGHSLAAMGPQQLKRQMADRNPTPPSRTHEEREANGSHNMTDDNLANLRRVDDAQRARSMATTSRSYLADQQSGAGALGASAAGVAKDEAGPTGWDRADGFAGAASELGGLSGTVAGQMDVEMALTNFGDHVDQGGPGVMKSRGDHFKMDGRSNGTDYENYNKSWANEYTGGVAGGASVLGLGASLYSGARTVKAAASQLREARAAKDRLAQAEAIGKTTESTASVASSGINAVNSVNNAAGAVTSSAWHTGIGSFGGRAVPIAGIVTGAMGMAKNSMQLGQATAGEAGLKDIANTTKDERSQEVARYAAKTMHKRRNRAGLNLLSNTAFTAGSAANATGVGVGVGASLATAGLGLKYGAMGVRNAKQFARNRLAKRMEGGQSYEDWASQRTGITGAIRKKLTPNWDKSSKNKKAKQLEMAKSLHTLPDKVDRKYILLNLGFHQYELEKVSVGQIAQKLAKRE